MIRKVYTIQAQSDSDCQSWIKVSQFTGVCMLQIERRDKQTAVVEMKPVITILMRVSHYDNYDLNYSHSNNDYYEQAINDRKGAAMREGLGHTHSSTAVKSINKSGALLFDQTLKKDGSGSYGFTENPMLQQARLGWQLFIVLKVKVRLEDMFA